MNDQNVLKGLFLAIIALVFGVGAYLYYPIGRIERAGPGFFPLLVSSFLFVLAMSMVIRSRFMAPKPVPFSVRNIAIILVSLLGFAALSELVNMISGIVFLVFISTIAGTRYSIRRNAAISAVLVAIAFAFKYGLGVQLPLY